MIWLFAAAVLFAQPVGYVNDFAGIISPAVEARLEAELETYTATSSNELAVVTLTSLEGDTIDNTAVAIFDQWGIGQKGKDNGVLLLVAPNEREVRIEVGYGLEPVLTDSRSGGIIRNVITPKFKAGDYDNGISDGVKSIIAVLSGQEIQPAADSSSNDGGWVAIIILIIFIWFFIWLFKHRNKTGQSVTSRSRWGGFSSGRSGGSSFGGFSGGRSGGGGASGKW